MCMLIAVNLPRQMSRMLLPMLLMADSSANKDGTGLLTFTNNTYSVWKTERAAKSMLDLGQVINHHVTNDFPVLAHVRSASSGMPVTEENAHPFSGARFVLFHNGRLYGENEHPQSGSA